MIDLHDIKNDLEELLYRVGQNIEVGFLCNEKNITEKIDKNDLVTKYDINANEMIISHLESVYPEISIISEEADEILKDSEYSFLVDPIDGTNNYIRGIPMFFTGIALSKDNKVILSITFNPITKDLFWAIKGKGTYLNSTKVSVSDRELDKSNIQIEIARNPLLVQEVICTLIEKIHCPRMDTCSHYGISNVSCGKYDAYISKDLFAWDYCQYLLIVEAGGKVTDWNGEEFDITKNNMIGSNNVAHNEIVNLIKQVIIK